MKHLTLDQWQKLFELYCRENPENAPWQLFYRCEDSQLTVGWKFGGFTCNGQRFTAFAPFHNGQVAMLAVRDDVVAWGSKNWKRVAG